MPKLWQGCSCAEVSTVARSVGSGNEEGADDHHADIPDRQTKFASFPEVLVVHAKKFQLVNWVPAKLGALPFKRHLSRH